MSQGFLNKKKLKIAIFHQFLRADCKGGGEKLVLDLRQYLGADLWVGSFEESGWGKQLAGDDDYVKKVWTKNLDFVYLHNELKIPYLKQFWRQFNFLLSPKIRELEKYDVIIFSGNIGFVPRRVAKMKSQKIWYVHTPPRPFTDQFESKLEKMKFWQKPIFRLLQKFILWQYKKDLAVIDKVVVNSKNIQNRLFKYTGIKADTILYPPVNTDKFKFLGQGDYFLSVARIEDLKRIKALVMAFEKMPEKKLIICSTGPLKDWLVGEIKNKNLKNIEYRGLVSEDELASLVGNCLAGIYIPVDEDFGMVPPEFMSAGKPVIGSKEGGLLETILDQKTGILIDTLKSNGSLESDKVVAQRLVQVIQNTPVETFWQMRKESEKQGQRFSQTRFFTEMEEVVNQ